MSIAVLTQIYDEARRLAVAGSAVAPGDFRLKKLLPPLEAAGAKAPVFAKVAENVKTLIDSNEATSAEALLELTSLVNAVLYTQGETGLPGTHEPIATTDLDLAASQTSARVLKPLLEALSSTGSGRLELIKDALERGAFRDLRLVKPSLAALDDGYGEIADLIAEKVLPLYGNAILPELRAKFDLKGKAGHARRLRLMHKLDPEGTQAIVTQALESGSKEVKVAAIACLGSDELPTLLEQCKAKAQEVRAAAYEALARIDDPAAIAALAVALSGKDLAPAAAAIRKKPMPKLVTHIIAEIDRDAAALPTVKDKKVVSETVSRLLTLLNTLPNKDEKTDALLLRLFDARDRLGKPKGDTHSGSDFVESLIAKMAIAAETVQRKLAESHADLADENLANAVDAANAALPPERVYEMFSPYFATKPGEKVQPKNRKAVARALGAEDTFYFWYRDEKQNAGKQPFDPRWLDLAVNAKDISLVHVFARPGHAKAMAFAKGEFDAAIKKTKEPDNLAQLLSVLLRLEHPAVTDCFFEALKRRTKGGYVGYYFRYFVSYLPKSAIPRLEALIPTLPDNEADALMTGLQKLREQP